MSNNNGFACFEWWPQEVRFQSVLPCMEFKRITWTFSIIARTFGNLLFLKMHSIAQILSNACKTSLIPQPAFTLWQNEETRTSCPDEYESFRGLLRDPKPKVTDPPHSRIVALTNHSGLGETGQDLLMGWKSRAFLGGRHLPVLWVGRKWPSLVYKQVWAEACLIPCIKSNPSLVSKGWFGARTRWRDSAHLADLSKEVGVNC